MSYSDCFEAWDHRLNLGGGKRGKFPPPPIFFNIEIFFVAELNNGK
jgi:hypothetical protein